MNIFHTLEICIVCPYRQLGLLFVYIFKASNTTIYEMKVGSLSRYGAILKAVVSLKIIEIVYILAVDMS